MIQAFDYGPGSGIHGLALSPSGETIYSADDTGNAIWTHRVDSRTGEVHFVDRLAAPVPGADPRHIVVHPGGGFAYVVFEGTNRLALYSIGSDGGLAYANISYPLIPPRMYHFENRNVHILTNTHQHRPQHHRLLVRRSIPLPLNLLPLGVIPIPHPRLPRLHNCVHSVAIRQDPVPAFPNPHVVIGWYG